MLSQGWTEPYSSGQSPERTMADEAALEADSINPKAQQILAAARQVATRFIEMLMTGRALAIYRIVVAETPRFPKLGRIFFEAGPNRLLGRFAEFLRRADERGTLAVAEPRRAAAQFIGMVRS